MRPTSRQRSRSPAFTLTKLTVPATVVDRGAPDAALAPARGRSLRAAVGSGVSLDGRRGARGSAFAGNRRSARRRAPTRRTGAIVRNPRTIEALGRVDVCASTRPARSRSGNRVTQRCPTVQRSSLWAKLALRFVAVLAAALRRARPGTATTCRMPPTGPCSRRRDRWGGGERRARRLEASRRTGLRASAWVPRVVGDSPSGPRVVSQGCASRSCCRAVPPGGRPRE